ncbi:MAG: acyl carrier protein [Deltaproteobacteria bacterium]|nr:acyl carrier protein [Deltaproteobacteria bacterium]
MTDQEIIDLINTSLAEEFELEMEVLTPEAHLFDDLELDSLDMVDMVIVLEHAFKFKIREEKAVRKIRTIGDIHHFVIKKVREVQRES